MSENDPDRITGWVPPSVEPPSVEPPPANPPLFYTDDEHQTDPIMHTAITLRDLFAGKAMQTMTEAVLGEDAGIDEKTACILLTVPEVSYKLADAMLAERAKREE